MALCTQLVRLVYGEKASGLAWGIVAAVLFIFFCPFLAFYQPPGSRRCPRHSREPSSCSGSPPKLAAQMWDYRKRGLGPQAIALGIAIDAPASSRGKSSPTFSRS